VTRRRAGRLGAAAVLVAVAAVAAALVLRQPTPTAAGPAPHFVDETAGSGVDLTYDGEYPFAVGGGVAVLDCDGDGRQDLYLAGGSGSATLYRNESLTGGALRFVAVSDPLTDEAGATGAYPLDVDADGTGDLAVLRDGENLLLRGLGGCRFEPGNERWGLDGGRELTTAFSATWEGAATLPTLAFGNYLIETDNPDPDRLCADNELFRPAADGLRYEPALQLSPAWCALSMLFSDWDRSGRRDLRVSNDRHYYSELGDGQEQLWRLAPGEPPRLYTADDGWVTVQIWGMGIGSYDLTGDGYPEAYLTSQGPNRLQTLTAGPGQPTYRDIALKRGVIATRPYAGDDPLPSTAWHPEFQDANNDGFIDLFVSKGNVDAQADYATKDPSNLFLGQPDGTFVEGAMDAGIVSFDRGRGAALADLNLDGLLDLVVSNYGDPVRLWRNVGAGTAASPAPMGHWLAVDVRQAGPNRNAIGAWLEARIGDLTARRELTIGGGHAGGQLGPIHLGLGPATSAEVRITWPDGEVGPWQRLDADATWIVERGADPVRRTPAPE
jgi:hypothetical protein